MFTPARNMHHILPRLPYIQNAPRNSQLPVSLQRNLITGSRHTSIHSRPHVSHPAVYPRGNPSGSRNNHYQRRRTPTIITGLALFLTATYVSTSEAELESKSGWALLGLSTKYRNVLDGLIGVVEADGNKDWAGPQGKTAKVELISAHDTELPPSFATDPSTSITHPLTIHPLPSTLSTSTTSTPIIPPSLTLIGTGHRSVSFLRVKVYSAAFYLEEVALHGLNGLDGWENYQKGRLLESAGAKEKVTKGMPEEERRERGVGGEKMMEKLVGLPVNCGIRIVPTRNTDFGHLRDGFTRALLARQKAASRAGKLTPEEDERISTSLQTFKSIFPNSSVPKHHSLLLLKTPDDCLSIEYEGKCLGQVKDGWVAREMMLVYFADEGLVSPALKESVASGFERLLRKP